MAAALWAITAHAQNFQKNVIYQIVTDRFFDGDPANNDPAESRGLYDPTHIHWWMYWGGDFAGIEKKMGYLQGMGVTAIWISPPVDNINVKIPAFGHTWTAYHGYWARDMTRIEEHFGDGTNSWAPFDTLIKAAHARGIKVIVDFAANHSNPDDRGEFGDLYDHGKLLAQYKDDPHDYFHHNPPVQDFNNRYQVQYYTLFDLADLNQENPTIDEYLKRAVRQFQEHGADGFRLDAVKHVSWGWLYSLEDSIVTAGPSFAFGEWFSGLTHDALYHDSYKFSNRSGMSLLNFPVAFAVRAVFTDQAGFDLLDKTLAAVQI